jgi:hypothetical protein
MNDSGRRRQPAMPFSASSRCEMLLLELACARPLHQRDELVAKADEGVALAPAAQGEPEDLAVERQCRIDIADLDRDVVDTHHSRLRCIHGVRPFTGRRAAPHVSAPPR